MNVVISNKYQGMLINLEIDIIKNLNGEFSVEELVSNFTNYYYNRMILDVTALKDYKDLKTYQQLSLELDMNKVILLLDDSPELENPQFISSIISMGIYNFTRNIDSLKFLIDNPNTYKDVAQFQQLNPVAPQVETVVVPGETQVQTVYVDRVIEKTGTRVIGFKNLTDGAGSTSLVYMLTKTLEKEYDVLAYEIDKHDFMFFNNEHMQSIEGANLQSLIMKNKDKDVILVDLNDPKYEMFCSDVVCLIEPGIVKLNRLIRGNKRVFEINKDKKIVLNKSTLTSKDVSDFEFESQATISFNIPYLDDRKENHKVLEDFLFTLGFGRFGGKEEKSGKLFGLFGRD